MNMKMIKILSILVFEIVTCVLSVKADTTSTLLIEGSAQPSVGKCLSAEVDGVAPVSYLWTRSNVLGENEEKISDSRTYYPTIDDYEHWLRVVSYMPDGNALTNAIFFSKLPVVYISGDIPSDINQGYRNVTLRMQGNEKYEESYVGASQLKVRGNSTSQWPKKPYKLKLDKKANPYGLGASKSKHWVLLANFLDQSLMRNALAGEIADIVGVKRMQSTWVDVVANGEYVGNYLLCEHVRVAEDRVDIFDWEKYAEDVAKQLWDPMQSQWGTLGIFSKGELETIFSENLSWVNTGVLSLSNGTVMVSHIVPEIKDLDLSGGYLYEMELRKDEISTFFTQNRVGVNIIKPEYAVTSMEMMDSAVEIVNRAEAAWSSETGMDAEGRHYTELVDMDSMVAFWLVNEIMGNADASNGGYMHVDRGGKVIFGPVWDFDWGAGCVTVGTDATGWKCSLKPKDQCVFNSWLKHADFRAAVRSAYLAHRADIQDIFKAGGLMESWQKYLAESGTADTGKWATKHNETFAVYGTGRGFSQDVEMLESYMTRRLDWLDSQFATENTFAESVGITNVFTSIQTNQVSGTENKNPTMGFVASMQSVAPTSITASVSAGFRVSASDEKFCEYKITGGGIISIDYSFDVHMVDSSGIGGIVCWIDGVKALSVSAGTYDSSQKRVLEWPLLSYGEHTIKWSVDASVCGTDPLPDAVDYYTCSCTLYVLNTTLNSWTDIGPLTKNDNGFTLQLTNNITRTVYFTDDLGEVILDLNGYSITGDRAKPGVQILHSKGTGTHLKIMDSRQTGSASVCGGEAYWSTDGSSGVEVIHEAENVFIPLSKNVSIKGGDGHGLLRLGWERPSAYDGGVGVIGNIYRNEGVIVGGVGANGLNGFVDGSTDCSGFPGGEGGCGVKGYIKENLGIIIGGKGGGIEYDTTYYYDDGYDVYGGIGGVGVQGNIGVNRGEIIGGEGGCAFCDDWYIIGGDGGIGVKGDVSNNTSGAFIIGGEGGWPYSVWAQGGYGGVAFEGNVITNNGTIAKGRNAGASVKVTCADCVYDGNPHSIEIEIYNLPEWFSLSRVTIGDDEVIPIDLGDGNYKATKTYIDVGSYSPVRIVGENEHWGYDDNNECEGFEILPKNVYLASVAIEDDYVYANCVFMPRPVITDVERGVALVEGQDYTLSYSNNKNAGVATVTVTGRGNYSGTVTRNFTIAKAEVVPPILAVKPYTGSAQAATVPANPLYRVVQNLPQTAPGTYPVMLELVDPANYRWPDSESSLYSVSFTITSKEEKDLEEIFGDLPAELEPDANGGWIVTLTDDIAGPVEIFGNLGGVTIDLNGYDMIGTDNEPAIRIVKGDGDGSATRLSLVTGGGDSFVQGGVNSPAIVVCEGVASIVINIGKGVTVRAGSEDVPSISGGEIGENEGTLVKVKVPVPVLPELEYTGSPQVPVLSATGIYTVSVSSGTNPGTYPIMATLVQPDAYEWILRDGATVVGATAIFTFTILDPPPAIDIEGGLAQGEANGASVKAVYDGRGHGISVTVVNPPTGATVRYSASSAGPFTYAKPLFTNVVHGAETWFEISAAGFDPVTNMATVTVEAKPLSQSMVAVKRLKENDEGEVVPVIELSDTAPCEIAQDDWTLVSWEPRASGGGTATIRGGGNYTGTLTIDVPNEMLVVFDAVYGSSEDVRTVTTQIPGHPYALPPTAPVYRGHDFLGWFTEREGGEEVTSSRTVSLSDPDVVYAHWKVKTYRVSFDLNGGTGDAPSFDASYGSAFNGLPHVTKPGYLFDGWWSTSDFRDGTLVQDGDSHPTVDTTLYAKWLRRALWYSDAIFHLESAAVYNGYLVDEDAGDVVAGTITVKAGKPNRKTGFSKLSVSVSIAGERKISLKGETFDGTLKAMAKDGRELDILLGESALTGRFGKYLIDGSRDIFSAKDEDSKLKAAQAMKEWQGVYMLAWEGDSGWNGLSLTINSKGKVKVSGALSNGTKVSATSLLLIGERESAIAVSWTKKDICVAFLVWLKEDGCIECSNLNGDGHVKIANSKSGAYLSEGSVFFCDPNEVLALVPEACTEILPDGQPVRMDGSSFDIDKAGKVKLLKDKSGLDLSKAGLNPSGLKLAYKIKDCTFKGSFTVYAIEKGRLKKHKVAVTGVVIDGVGYGTATIKKLGSWTVEIR